MAKELAPKLQVKARYYAEGEAAATELAKEFESITPGKLKRWFNEWGGPPAQEKAAELDAYATMIRHYEPIHKWKEKHPGRKDLPDDLDEADDEIRAICKKRSWSYPGDPDANVIRKKWD